MMMLPGLSEMPFALCTWPVVVVMLDQRLREQLRRQLEGLGGHGWQRQQLLLQGRRHGRRHGHCIAMKMMMLMILVVDAIVIVIVLLLM